MITRRLGGRARFKLDRLRPPPALRRQCRSRFSGESRFRALPGGPGGPGSTLSGGPHQDPAGIPNIRVAGEAAMRGGSRRGFGVMAIWTASQAGPGLRVTNGLPARRAEALARRRPRTGPRANADRAVGRPGASPSPAQTQAHTNTQARSRASNAAAAAAVGPERHVRVRAGCWRPGRA